MRTLSGLALITSALWRPSWKTLALEVPLLAAVSALVVFFFALPLKTPLDGIAFQLSASYERALRLPAGSAGDGELVVDVLDGFPVAPSPGRGESLAYTPDLARLEMHIVEDLDAYVRDFLGTNLVEWSGSAGVLLDQDTAARMRVGLGDALVLLVPHVVDGLPIEVEVAGFVRPYPTQGENSMSGLVAVEEGLLPSDFVTRARQDDVWSSVTKSRVIYEPNDATAETQTRGGTLTGHVMRLLNPLYLAPMAGLLICATALWGAVMIRSFGHVARRMRPRAVVLAALGAVPKRVAICAVTPQALAAAMALTMGTIAIQSLVFPLVLRRTLQASTVLAVSGLLMALTLLVAAFALHAMRRTLTGPDVATELSREEGS